MIKYSKGYKYQLEEYVSFDTPIAIGYEISTKYFRVYPNGKLEIYRGYAWDGASGPTIDTDSSMTPSMVHDVFCQCMRDRSISYDLWQDAINDFFREQCLERGMCKIRANIWHAGVEFGDAGNPIQGPDRPVFTAP